MSPSLTNGLNLVANNLDFDGTGTNNLMTNVLNGVPSGTTVFKFAAGNFQTILYGRGGWSGAAGVTLNPGEACFVSVPAPQTITTVGQVLQGTWTNNLSGALTMVSSIAPLAGTVDSTGNGGLNYVPQTGDIVFLWDPVGQGYVTYLHGRGGWSPSDPAVSVGQGFFLDTAQTTWVNTFTVQ